MISPLVFLILSLASYRLTRFFIHDSLMGLGPDSGTGISAKLDAFGYNQDGSDRSFLRGKVADLFTCHYCLSFWISCATLALWTWSLPWQVESPQTWVLTAFAISGVVALVYEWVDKEPTTILNSR